MKIVNGFVCECAGEAQLAKRGIDPKNPHQDPVKQRELDEKRGKIPDGSESGTQLDKSANLLNADAVRFGGALSGLGRDTTAGQAQQANLVDLLA